MNYWLIKSEPESYSLDDFRKEKIGRWDGVRNYTARNNLRAMKIDDICIFYRSVTKPAVIALSRVTCEAYPDPTIEDPKDLDRWSCVEVELTEEFPTELSLADIKTNDLLKDMALLKLSRLSVQPVRADEFEEICRICRKKQ